MISLISCGKSLLQNRLWKATYLKKDGRVLKLSIAKSPLILFSLCFSFGQIFCVCSSPISYTFVRVFILYDYCFMFVWGNCSYTFHCLQSAKEAQFYCFVLLTVIKSLLLHMYIYTYIYTWLLLLITFQPLFRAAIRAQLQGSKGHRTQRNVLLSKVNKPFQRAMDFSLGF